MRPLEGITVIALEHAIAAPFATRQLADQGARVIKIERPGVGDFARHYDDRVKGLSSHFVWTNRSKDSLSLDLKHPEAGKILQKLLGRADVLVQNLAPGAAARLGLARQALMDEHPKLIVCNISGYGDEGPDKDRKAYDLLIQSETGFLSVTGTEGAPSKAGISVADIAAGMYAYSGILTALIQRSKTGEGSTVDVSMLDAMAEWMGFPMYYAFDGATAPARSGGSHATIFPYGPFTAGDGKTVMLGLQNEREWINFCNEVLQDASIATDLRFSSNTLRSQNQSQLRDIIHSSFADISAHEVRERLDKAGIANAQLNTMADLWSHPQLAARNRWRDVDTPSGPVSALLPAASNDTFEPRMGAVPALGESTQIILSELGYSSEQIETLKHEGAI